jgi:hypothetical protein
MNDETRDERLRRMLREGDPANAEGGLTREESHQMRRTVLTAIPEPRRRFALSPALAGAAMAALVAILAILLWPRPEATAPQPPAPPRIAVKEPVTDVKRTDVKRTDKKSTDVKRRTRAVAAGLRARRPAASAPGEQLAAVEGPHTRQIQFDTPGGTRVIWVLRSDNAL